MSAASIKSSKIIAFVVLATFIPDQVSWSLGIIRRLVYRNLPVANVADAGLLAAKANGQIAGSLEYLLKQVQGKPNLRLQVTMTSLIP